MFNTLKDLVSLGDLAQNAQQTKHSSGETIWC